MVSIWLDKLLQIRELIGFNVYLIFNKDSVTEITFWLWHRKKYDENERNVKIRIEETLSLWKVRAVIKENAKISKYQNSQ